MPILFPDGKGTKDLSFSLSKLGSAGPPGYPGFTSEHSPALLPSLPQSFLKWILSPWELCYICPALGMVPTQNISVQQL